MVFNPLVYRLFLFPKISTAKEGNALKRKTVINAAACLVAACLTAASIGAYAAEMKWSYNEATKTVSVKGYGMINDATELKNYLNDTKIIDVLKGVTKIEKNVFSSLENVEEVKLPEGLVSIGDNSFSLSSELKKINLPDSLESIGAEAFMGCSSLESVSIPKNVSSIGGNAFAGCTSVTGFEVSADNSAFVSVDGVIFSKDKKELVMYPAGKTDEEYTVPEGTEKIGSRAFAYNENLNKVIMATTVKEIGDYAFYYCDSLRYAELVGEKTSSLKSIGNYAFYGCKLRRVTLPFGTETVGEDVFKNCDTLTYIDIPQTVTSIGNEAFYGVNDSFKIAGFGSIIRVYAQQNGVPFEETVRVVIGGKEIVFDCPATVRDGCTMVPMRKIFEELGADVSWDGETQTAQGEKDGNVCKITIGDNKLYKNGQAKELLAPAILENGRTLVHVRAIAEAFENNVLWDGDKGLVTINSLN